MDPPLPPPGPVADCDEAPPGSPPAPAQHPAHRQQLQHAPAAHGAPAVQQRISPLAWVLLAFTLLLVAVGLRDNPTLRRFLRRQLGLRII